MRKCKFDALRRIEKTYLIATRIGLSVTPGRMPGSTACEMHAVTRRLFVRAVAHPCTIHKVPLRGRFDMAFGALTRFFRRGDVASLSRVLYEFPLACPILPVRLPKTLLPSHNVKAHHFVFLKISLRIDHRFSLRVLQDVGRLH